MGISGTASRRNIRQNACHEDYTFWDPVPDALIAVTPSPGPLEDETRLILADCYQSTWLAGGRKASWYEREVLTILNPNPEPVRVHLRYYLRRQALGDAGGASLNGDFTMTFRLYAPPEGGNALWTETCGGSDNKITVSG